LAISRKRVLKRRCHLMRFANRPRLILLLAASALAISIPVLSQDKPESILPPGFGDPVEDDGPKLKPPTDGDVLGPDSDGPSADSRSSSRPSGNSVERPRAASSDFPPLPSLDDLPGGLPAKDGEADADAAGVSPILQDLPAHVRRSTANVGVLHADDGDMGAGAFQSTRGSYLSHLMRTLPAPVASRWASITLRRALMSRVNTPADVNGADFAAERAFLLLRMGEAEASRMMVQAVDADQYTPFMRNVAMQTALANADPAGLCPMVEGNPDTAKEPYWIMSRAICSAFSGESALASALVDQIRDRDKAPIIDVLLAEKVVGAAGNTRRSVNILWEDVSDLSAWRYGLATATALPIPDPLMQTVGPRVRAWRARAPLLTTADRVDDADVAAALGVFSSAGLVDHYATMADEGLAPNAVADSLQAAFAGPNAAARLAAMKAIWSTKSGSLYTSYARSILTARAAARLPSSSDFSGDSDAIIASMFSTGLDVQAAKWFDVVSSGSLGWAMLMVGLPERPKAASGGDVTGMDSGVTGKRAQFFLAGLAGLGRIDAGAASSAAETLGMPLGRQTAWTKAIVRAADAKEAGTVALLAAIGLQGESWAKVSPTQMYHAIAALRKVGLEGEARMIAAEALARS
jgi:hypothetical protein